MPLPSLFTVLLPLSLVLSFSFLPPDAQAQAQAQVPIFIGPLSELQHDVSGNLYALDSRTLLLTDLTYDGRGPAGVFWADTGSSASDSGRLVPFKDSCEADTRLPRYAGVNVTLELPSDLTLSDIGYFSMWCRAVSAEFGGIRIPADFITTNSVPIAAAATCADEDEEEMSGVFPVRDDWNCERLSEALQVRWRLNDDAMTVSIELVTRMSAGQYVGFGPSGADDFTQMVGSDVAIGALLNIDPLEFSIEDYSMSSRAQCSNGIGVCPDVTLAENTGTESLTSVAANHSEGVTQFTYTRPLEAVDVVDRDIKTTGEGFVTWALGPFAAGVPNFHPSGSYPTPDSDGVVRVMLEWGRPASNGCPVFSGDAGDTGAEDKNTPGFLRPALINVTDITARIGPSGGERGVGTISNGTAWGIAWYLSETESRNDTIGTLIPVLAVERGKTYTFRVYGGYASDGGHPFYITNSSQGGYAARSARDRLDERVYAGVRVTASNESGVYEYEATAEGELCTLQSNVTNTTRMTWEEYKDTIDESCNSDTNISENPGILNWTVPQDADDVLFYQCVTHRFLGFRVAVFDAGAVNETRVAELSGGGELKLENDNNQSACTTSFGDEGTITFAACDLTSFAPLQLFFTADTDGNTLDTLARVPRGDGDYVALGWGFDAMVVGNGSYAVVGTAAGNASMFSLTSRSDAGVTGVQTPAEVSAQVDVTDEFLSLRFSRPLKANGPSERMLPVLRVEDDSTPCIWATGATGGGSLQQHAGTRRGVGLVNLADGTAESITAGANLRGLMVHGIMMTVAWALFVPWAIVAMRFGKRWNPTAFNVHRSLNGLAVLLVIAAFIAALASSVRTSEVNHRVIGYIVVGFACVQAVGGAARPGKESQRRRLWYYVHVSFGVTATTLAIVNIFRGIGLGFLSGAVAWRVGTGVSVGVAVAAAIMMTLLPRTFPTKETGGRYEEEEAL